MEKNQKDLISCYPTLHDSAAVFVGITNKLYKQNNHKYHIAPSEYMKQILMTTEERFDYLMKTDCSTTIQPSCGNNDSCCFKITPCIVLFQQFIPGRIYNVTLTVRNVSNVSKRLKFSRDPDPFFSVEYHSSNYSTMIAPGLVHVYNVSFNPTEIRDYEYRIQFISNTEVFTVPVIAIGSRPILDIPDRIEIPATAVKISSSKTILVRNIGDSPAVFNFYADNSCFSVEPSKGILREEETMQLTVNFLSEKCGNFESNLFLNYESEEKVCLELRSSAVNCTIRVDRGSIRMEDTYLGLSRSKVLTIHNRSDYVVRFQWMRFKDKDADVQRKEKYEKLFQSVRDTELTRSVSLVHYNICQPDIHELVCQRIYADEIVSLMNENFQYSHMSFLLTPEKGEIWPQSSTDVTVIFRAMEVGDITSVAFLEVTGREDRISLSLHATGKGPVFHLNVITIDLKNVFLCSVHNYEIIATNKGHICGTVVYKAKPTDFGGNINVTPSALTLDPNEYKSFNLSFSSNRKGDFVERIDFIIKESLEILSLHIKGCIVCPTLHFDKSSLDFGTTALGFSRRQEVYLRNLSMVPVSFSVTIIDDGDQIPLTHEEFAKSKAEASFPTNPHEFSVIPQKGSVHAHNSCKLKVTYTANVIRTGRSIMRVDMWDSDSNSITLPILFCGAVPVLLIQPVEIFIRFSFVNFPYSRSINIENNSDLDGYFYIIPQTVSENIPILYSVSPHQGFIKARQSKTIDVTIIAKVLGRQETTLRMLTMGEEGSVGSCTIICNCQGPVVTVQPINLDFGEIPVLCEKSLDFFIINDSPIPAQFKLTSDKKNSPCFMKPLTGELGPNESMKIEVKIFLRDVGKCIDNIIAHVINSRSIHINVFATGIGCSIVFEPQIFPIFDMGLLFSRQIQNLPISIKNHGTRHYQIMWTINPEMRIQKNHTFPTSKFRLEPATVEIAAGDSIVVHCKIRWDTNELLTEDWYVFGQIHGQGKRELIGSSIFKAVFMEPQIIFDKEELMFRIDMYSDGEKLQQTDELLVTNKSRLNLNVQVHVNAPFYLTNDNKKYVNKKKITLEDGTATAVSLTFLPNIIPEYRYSQDYNGILRFEYDEHPNKNKIQCRGTVNFPNITITCKDVIINCVLGSSAEKTLELINNGPLPATYKFLWLGETIEIQRGARNTEDITDYSELQINTENYTLISDLYNNKENSKTRENDVEVDSTKSLVPLISSLYEKPNTEDSLTKMFSQTLDATLEEIRNTFSSAEICCLTCLKDTKINSLLDPNFESPTKELLDNVLNIVPHKGSILPYSSQRIRFIFHGSEPMQVKAVAICEILQGPTEVVNVSASADIVRYSVDKRVIDFGQQLFGELCRSSLTLENRSTIFLDYKINERNLISNTGKSASAISALTIEPNIGSIDPLSSMKIEIEFQPIFLGGFEIEFELQVAHMVPLIITVKGVTSYPQVYPYILRSNIFELHSVELGYQAIQLLSSDFIVMKREVITKHSDIKDQAVEEDREILLKYEWDLVSCNEIFPSVIDIEMAIDRFLATRFIEDNISTWIKNSTTYPNNAISFFHSPGYIIDMGYIVIDAETCYSTIIVNYGFWDAKVTMKKLQEQHKDSGILIQFKKTLLAIGETTSLTITWHPMPLKYTEKNAEEEHLIYLQVSRGNTVPLTIRGIITYPFVTVNTKLLNFQNVIVGECLMMSVLVKNEGFVNCCWEAKISANCKKQKECPFTINYKFNILSPGQAEIINVYFKPRRMYRAEAILKIVVKMGLEMQTIMLFGHGVEHNLQITDLDVKFLSITPFTGTQEKIFTIKNIGDYPVEFFWHHLDSLFPEEERVVEVLTRYYGVKEILLPPRKLGERMSSFLMEFYNSLVSEMMYALSTKAFGKENVTILKEYTNGEREISDNQHSSTHEKLTKKQQKISDIERLKQKEHSFTSIKYETKDCPPMPILNEIEFPQETIMMPTISDPKQIQNLLFYYIDTLRKHPNFPEKMKDPVKDLVYDLERKSMPEDNLVDCLQSTKKVCIIFHGAPFTEYQETACKSAKMLKVPLLYIDNVIIESIAIADNWSSIKIREIIDNAYMEHLSQFEKYKDILLETTKVENATVEHSHEAKERLSKSSKVIKSNLEAITEMDRHSQNNFAPEELINQFETEAEFRPLEELAKIPVGQNLKILDPISHYEYKIQTISLLCKIFSHCVTIGLIKDKMNEKTTEKSQNDTFLGIEIDLLTEILRERLSLSDFKKGFVLQTLRSTFFKSEIVTLLALLDIVGPIEYPLFVTFPNSMDKYTRKMEELRELKAKKLAEEIASRVQEIDEMSLCEYELLSEDEKKFFLLSTLPIKKQEAQQRRMQFVQQMTELRKRKELSRRSSNATMSKNKKINTVIKNKKTDHHEEKTRMSKVSTNKKEIRNRKESKISSKSKKQEISKKSEDIANSMNDYYTNLSAIENIIKNWDPFKKDTPLTAKSKTLKIDKLKDRNFDVNNEKIHSDFYIWYINAADPWNQAIYNMVINQINTLANKILTTDTLLEPNLESKRYHIFKPKGVEKRDIANNGSYQIVSLSPVLESSIVTTSPECNNVPNKNENNIQYVKRGKRSRMFNKTEDIKSLNASTVESKDTNASNLNAIREDILKPRWVLQPQESQIFKIRYQPKETGPHRQIYTLSIIDGGDIIYDINVFGEADIPKLDVNPNNIFSKIEERTLDDINDPTYFLDTNTFDFGSLLAFRKDISVHRCAVEFKFHNISKVAAEVCFYLQENNPDIFIIKPNQLYIQAGQCELLKISAGVTKPGSFTDKLHICIKNNPHVDIIEMRCNGTKLDIELEDKNLSFKQVLLYRRDILTCTIRNNSPVQIYWRLRANEPIDPQVSFTPVKGIIAARNDQKIEFCYHANNVGTMHASLIFEAFFDENDIESIFTENLSLSGETYDVAVDINHANPIDLNCVQVGFPANANITIRNRGNYEVKYVVLLEEQSKLTNIDLPINLKKDIEFHPISGSVQSQKEAIVQITLLPRNEITLKKCPILRCHLLDMNKQAAMIAELPLTVSLVAYYSRFRVYPYPEINFGSLAICTKRTMYLNIENTGNFPLHYSIQFPSVKRPSNVYMTQIKTEDMIKKDFDNITDSLQKKDKKSSRADKSSERKVSEFAATLKIGPFTITNTEKDIQPGNIDIVEIECYPEFVGSQQEEIMVLVEDSIPEDRNGKLITLTINSCIPNIDFQDLNGIFYENHIVNYIQDFMCSKVMDAYTVFARQEKCLYFRYVCVSHTYTTYFVLYNRNLISANVELTLLSESLMSRISMPHIFVVTPEKEHIPSMSHKRFKISFTPSFIETYHAVLEIAVVLPQHLQDEKLSIKLIGETCVPEVTILEPSCGKRERAVLNFDRTLVDDTNSKKLSFKNTGVIKAKVIVEIYDDPNFLFALEACNDMKNSNVLDYESSIPNDRSTTIYLMPDETTSFKIKCTPLDIGNFGGQMRLFLTDNPYENLIIDLKGNAYKELIVLEGLELVDIKSDLIYEKQESNNKLQGSLKPHVIEDLMLKSFPISLAYKLDFGYCFVDKIYRRSFKIINKSVSQYLRFQWSTHKDVVFAPSIGHLKQQTSKEIVATFLSSEPTDYIDTRLDCSICTIELVNSSEELCWDDRQTKVQWVTINSDAAMLKGNTKTLARKMVEPVNEPSHEIVPGTMKCIQVLLNAIVAFSKYSCLVKEITFNDTLMFQTREYVFSFSNTGAVDIEYEWQINMDEQYPIKLSPRRNIRSAVDSSMLELHEYYSQYSQNYTMMIEDENIQLNRKELSPSSTDNIVEMKPASFIFKATDPSDLFSSTAGLTERSSDSWLGSDELPFGIYPEKGILPPGESMECILRFSPKDVFDYKAYLTCKVENLDPKLPEFVVSITGRSLLPYCHFDVPESDYLSGNRRDAKLPGPIDYELVDGLLPEDTRIIELNVVGTGKTHIKNFRMINPTSDDYFFTWTDRTLYAEGEIPSFHCVFSEGIAERGKQIDLSFMFFAQNLGTFESFWLFFIEKHNLECLFLFVATVREPVVHCSLVHLRMEPTVLGISVRKSINIINNEEFQIPFQILPESLHSEGCFQSLTIMPMNGILHEKNEQTLWIEYQPTLIGEFQFSIKCIIKGMKTPLTIFVTTTVYEIIASVTYVDQNGQVVLLKQNQENIIECGKLILKMPITIMFEITNLSRITFGYTWNLGMTPEVLNKSVYTITMSEKQGYVTNESRYNCYLTLTASQRTLIKDHPIVLKIAKGPTYRLILKATASKSLLEFSFNRYDFGACYIQDITAAPYHVNLCITNSDQIPYILECKFKKRPYIYANLDVLSEQIAAQSSISIPIKFRPLEQVHYREDMHFIINSTIEKKIIITGEGITYKIRLVNPRDKSVDFGNLPINKTSIKKVPVINDGRAAVELKFDLMKNLPGFEQVRERIQACPKINRDDVKKDQIRTSISETKRSDTFDSALQTIEPELSEVLEIRPIRSMVLRPGKTINILIRYKSMRRMCPFVVKVAFQANSTIVPLFILRGSCIGPEFRLNRTYLSFGTVIYGYFSEGKMVLSNVGDIGARFKWNASQLPRDFSIAPITGYCSPGMDVNFVISFRPIHHDSLVEGNASLEIEKYKNFDVKVIGSCYKLPEPLDTLLFSCHVREKVVRSLNVENDTVTSWELKPEITGDYFFVNEVLRVPSNSSTACTITYAPLAMNDENNFHKGTLVLKLSDDKAPLVYSLQGLSFAPQALQRITRQFPAKIKYTESLPVYNWTNKYQRFECKIEHLDNTKLVKETYAFTFIGSNKIDVAANSQRDYHAEFHSYKEFDYEFKIMFTNQEGEYQFYELRYKVTKPEKIDSIKLVSSVRVPVCHALRLDNPLESQEVKYVAECQHPCITIHDVPKIVAPSSSGTIGIEYHPIHPSEESVEILDINCEELGLFPYELRLRATPAIAEKTTRIDATLGSSSTLSLTISNQAKTDTIFTIEVNDICFTTPKNVAVPALENSSFDVTYEPCDIDNVSATLKAISDIAGEFVFPLVGTYSLPRPQGPYLITSKKPALIPFKNIFRGTKSFEFIWDNPTIFTTPTSLENIKSKQVINVVVRLNDSVNGYGTEGNNCTTGKFLIYCTDTAISHIIWTYYLKYVSD